MRALQDKTQNVRSYPEEASCNPSDVSATESHSIVSESMLTYILKYICLGFVVASNPSSDLIIARCKSREDWINITYLLLLNTVFIELKKQNDVNASIPYHVIIESYNGDNDSFIFTNQGNGQYQYIEDRTNYKYEDVKVYMKAIKPKHKRDVLFATKNANQIEDLGVDKDMFINTKAFYLENENVSGRILQFDKQNNNKYIVFRKDFETLYNKKNTENNYHFCKLISTIYNNIKNQIPTFTISFSIKFPSEIPMLSSTAESTIILLEMFMNNELGLQRQRCPKIDNMFYPLGFNKNGNIITVAVQYPKQNNMLKLQMGASIDGCLYENERNTLTIDIPSLPPNSTMNMTITTNGTSIMTLMQWNDSTVNKNQTIKDQQWICAKQNVDINNDFYKLFMSNRTETPTSRLEDIIINTNDVFIENVKEVVLGYKNFAQMVYDRNQI